MQSQPYSGWALFVNVLVAIGTIGAVIVALFGDWFRFKLFRPTLNIRLLDPEGEAPLLMPDPNGVIADFARWYQFRVGNSRRWLLKLTDADVRLLQVEELGQGSIGWGSAWGARAPNIGRKHDN